MVSDNGLPVDYKLLQEKYNLQGYDYMRIKLCLEIARVNCFCHDKKYDEWVEYVHCSSDHMMYSRESKDVVDLTALYRKYKASIPSEQERWLSGE